MNIDELKANYDVKDFVEYSIPIPTKPAKGLVLIVGNSGSGKTTI